MSELKYTSSIKDMPLLFSEMKRTALLLCEGKTAEEILQLSNEKNIYQFEKEKRRKDVALRMIKRLSTLGKPLVEIIAHGPCYEAKLISFLALMKSDRLIFEYMVEVYLDKADLGYDEITDMDFLHFIDRKAQNSETVAKWTTNTLKGIRTKIKNALCEAELAKRTKEGLLIHKPLVDEGINGLIDEQDWIYAKAMLLLED